MVHSSDRRLAILLHDGIQGTQGKTGLALIRFCPQDIAVVIDRTCAGENLSAIAQVQCDAPIVATVAESLAYHPNQIAIGLAPSGGILPPSWLAELQQAVMAGLSIVNGLHTPLAAHPELAPYVQQSGQTIWDVRQEPPNLGIGTGKARTLACQRILTVGTDMGIGKMSTSLALDRAAQAQGLRSRFLATGQAGIMISGDGVALDAVRVDFAAGAIEHLVLQHGHEYDFLQIEGQGSVLHPGSTATLPLIRGSQPTQMILVHRAGQTHLRTCPDIKIPPLDRVVQLYEAIASAGGTFASVSVVAVALNTAQLNPEQAAIAIETVEAQTGLPCADPIRQGGAAILRHVMS